MLKRLRSRDMPWKQAKKPINIIIRETLLWVNRRPAHHYIVAVSRMRFDVTCWLPGMSLVPNIGPGNESRRDAGLHCACSIRPDATWYSGSQWVFFIFMESVLCRFHRCETRCDGALHRACALRLLRYAASISKCNTLLNVRSFCRCCSHLWPTLIVIKVCRM